MTNYIWEEGLKPGERLPAERELMIRLSVGRSSLREALKTLSAVGAVEILGREGTFVGRGSAEMLTKRLFWDVLLGERSMDEVVEARRLVEVDLAGLAAERASEEETAALARQLDRMRATIGNVESYSDHDVGFHLAVARAAHNRILSQVLLTMRHVIRAWIRKNILDVHEEPQSFEEHIPIYEAISRHDSRAARLAMGDHLERAATRIEAGLSDRSLRT